MLIASSKVSSGSIMMLPENIVDKIMLYVTHHPVAMMYRTRREAEEGDMDCIINYKCDECLGEHSICICGGDEWRFYSKAELLYNIKSYRQRPSHKLEKMLETKVIMNWLERNMDTTDRKPKNLDIEWQGLQEWFPTFCHCNKDIIYICFNMLIRNVELDLNKYEQFI